MYVHFVYELKKPDGGKSLWSTKPTCSLVCQLLRVAIRGVDEHRMNSSIETFATAGGLISTSFQWGVFSSRCIHRYRALMHYI
jgi:hypothetical protein